MASIGDLELRIVLQTAGVVAGTQQVTTELKNVEGQAVKTTETISTGFGTKASGAAKQFFAGLGLGVIGFAALGMGAERALSFIVKKFVEGEQASTKLLFSLNNDTGAFNEMSAAAEEMMGKSIFDDEDIKNAMSFEAAQGRTTDQIKKTIQAAMNLQAVLGGDLQSNLMKLDMTYEGSIGRLGRLDSRIKDLSAEELANGKVVDIINDKYNGFSEKMATTYAGRWEQFKNKIGEGAKNFGNDMLKMLNSLENSGYRIIGFLQTTTGGFLNWLAGAVNDTIKILNYIPGVNIGGVSTNWGEGLIKEGQTNEERYRALHPELYLVGPLPPTGKYNPPGKDNLPGSGTSSKTKEEEEALGQVEEKEKELGEKRAELAKETEMQHVGRMQQLNEEIKKLEEEINFLKSGFLTTLEKPDELAKFLSGVGSEKIKEDLSKAAEEYRNLRMKYDQEVRDNNIGLIGDEYEKKKAMIEAALADEIQKIKTAYASLSPEEQQLLINQAKAKAEKEKKANETEQEQAKWKVGINAATQITSILNQKPTTLFGYFQQMLGIAQQIALLMGAGSAASFLGPIGALVGGFAMLFGGHRQGGGNVEAGKYYEVGESGRERFYPGLSGYIMPNHAINGGGGSTVFFPEEIKVKGKDIHIALGQYNKINSKSQE